MKKTVPLWSIRWLLALLLPLPLVSRVPLHAADVPVLHSPAAGAVVYAPHPHFRWHREADARIDEVHSIQIARDENFADVVCEDRLEVVSRFVPVHALEPAKYWWRVRRGGGDWSPAPSFEVRSPGQLFTIPAGSAGPAVARILQEAAVASQGAPARVDFEPGTYALAPQVGESLVTLTGARDLLIDGHGARLVLAGTFLALNQCQRVAVRHLTLASERAGHTLVRAVKKDPAAMTLTVKPDPGYAGDVLDYFKFPGTAGSFLGCMDPVHHGKYLVGAFVSARNARMTRAEDGAFVLHPVKPETLERIPLGNPAVVTAYGWHWLKTTRTEECAFSELTLESLPGALCAGGGNDTAKSFLRCRVKRLAGGDYFGGHSHTASGRIGEWIEGCEFECLADDGPAQQSFRSAIHGTDGTDALMVGGTPVREGDRVAVVNARNGRGASAGAVAVKGSRVQLDRPVSELAAAIGHDVAEGWKHVFIYRDAPSNEDFVYRHNRLAGGRAHGVKFNGTRAWIADNHFENINGNAVLAGYNSEVSGHGARDVVVSGNTMVRCGWTPVEIRSTSGLGGNVVVRSNRIVEAREAAIAVRGCDGVRIENNTFSSTAPPLQGVWIITRDAPNLRTEGNTHPAEVPLRKPVE